METYYSKEHEWITVSGNQGTIGITEFAAHQLGDITYVELPKIGKEFKQSQILCAIESVKAASDIYAPLSGKVLEVNTNLENAPQIVNEKAETDGWIAKIELSNPAEKSNLMNRAQYDEYLKGL